MSNIRQKENSLVDAFYYACESGHLDVVQYLHSQGVGDVRKLYRHYDALNTALMNKHRDIVNFLLSVGYDVRHYASAAVIPAMQGDLEMLRVLCDRGADLRYCESHDPPTKCYLDCKKWLQSQNKLCQLAAKVYVRHYSIMPYQHMIPEIIWLILAATKI